MPPRIMARMAVVPPAMNRYQLARLSLGKARSRRADHQRNQEIPQRCRDGRDQEEEDHDHAVNREQAVVGFLVDESAVGRHECYANKGGSAAADEEEECDAEDVEDRDPLVVFGEQPRANGVSDVEIRLPLFVNGDIRDAGHCLTSANARSFGGTLYSLSPVLGGEGWGEGLLSCSRGHVFLRTTKAPHPNPLP